MSLKIKIMIAAIIAAVGIASAVTIPKVQAGTFNTTETRVLNRVFTGIAVDTNTTTVTSNYVPTKVGQILIGGNGSGTNAVWYASALTATNWVKISELLLKLLTILMESPEGVT